MAKLSDLEKGFIDEAISKVKVEVAPSDELKRIISELVEALNGADAIADAMKSAIDAITALEVRVSKLEAQVKEYRGAR